MAEQEEWLEEYREHRAWRMRAAAGLVKAVLLAVLAVLLALLVLWLIWVGIPRLTVPAASEADLRGVPAEVKWQARDNRRKLQNDARTTLLQGLGGLVVLAGATLAYRQLSVAREGQVTERFTRAIEQLGHDNLDVRLGGIYALERVAADSPRDQSTVNEVLTAFVRGHAPWPPNRPGQPPEDLAVEDIVPLQQWAPDVQAALTVLGRREDSPGPSLDLRNTDLRGAHLHKAYLSFAILQGARLQGATLTYALLDSAQLEGAHLQGANLYQTQLLKAHLDHTQLQKTHLLATKMKHATLHHIQLQEAVLEHVDLRAAILDHAQLQGATLLNTRLLDAIVHECEWEGAECDAHTTWSQWFDWKAAGIRLRED
jgi:Pentapeptide repeats (8 copies)/Pentapeptide repeats (9 copies)